MFATEAPGLLLFLRNLERCEVLLWEAGAAAPRLLHTTSVQVRKLADCARFGLCVLSLSTLGLENEGLSSTPDCVCPRLEVCTRFSQLPLVRSATLRHMRCVSVCATLPQGVTPELRRQRAMFQVAGSSTEEAESSSAAPSILSVHRLTLAMADCTLGDGASDDAPSHRRNYLIGQSNAGGGGSAMAAFARDISPAFGAPLTPWGAVAAPIDAAGELPGTSAARSVDNTLLLFLPEQCFFARHSECVRHAVSCLPCAEAAIRGQRTLNGHPTLLSCRSKNAHVVPLSFPAAACAHR